jgi:hypothetical protein
MPPPIQIPRPTQPLLLNNTTTKTAPSTRPPTALNPSVEPQFNSHKNKNRSERRRRRRLEPHVDGLGEARGEHEAEHLLQLALRLGVLGPEALELVVRDSVVLLDGARGDQVHVLQRLDELPVGLVDVALLVVGDWLGGVSGGGRL